MQYSIQQVRDIVGLPADAVRRFVATGVVSPERGKRREYRFSFGDLIVLRMAKGLADAKLSNRKISNSLKRLRGQLPAAPPLSGLRIAAIGNTVVVQEGTAQWRADDGQYLLAFDVAQTQRGLEFAELRRPPASADPDWFTRACELEDTDAAAAMAAYEKATGEDACQSGAYTNWGRLLHAAGRLAEAEAVYLKGSNACPDDAILWFNFAILREDQKRASDAIALYKQALANDPSMQDAHYNLGLLFEALRRPRDAVRHFNAYRQLAGAADPAT